MFRLAAFVALLGLLSLGIVAYSIFSPYQGFGQPPFVEIEKGMPTRAIAAKLEEVGVVRYSWQFLLVRALRPSVKLQAGEYRFDKPASAYDVLGRIARGDVFYYEVTVPEGSNIFDIASIAAETGIIKESDFISAAADPSAIHDLDPKAATLEGYLFPSTYRITRRTTAAQLCRSMTEQFRKEWKSLNTAASIHDTVTLASLVEKETGAPQERPIVASVFHNRLRIGMRLDCDPTTIYAAKLQDRYRGKIHKSDLASQSEYNTYQHAGLPPGPIANPGLAALKAALSPAETKYLYFVAKPGGGSHNFAADMTAHKRNVEAYRSAEKSGR